MNINQLNYTCDIRVRVGKIFIFHKNFKYLIIITGNKTVHYGFVLQNINNFVEMFVRAFISAKFIEIKQ